MKTVPFEMHEAAVKLRNELSFFCSGLPTTVVASAMSDLLVEIYRSSHPSPSLDNYLEQMRATYEHYMAQERKGGNA